MKPNTTKCTKEILLISSDLLPPCPSISSVNKYYPEHLWVQDAAKGASAKNLAGSQCVQGGLAPLVLAWASGQSEGAVFVLRHLGSSFVSDPR